MTKSKIINGSHMIKGIHHLKIEIVRIFLSVSLYFPVALPSFLSQVWTVCPCFIQGYYTQVTHTFYTISYACQTYSLTNHK